MYYLRIFTLYDIQMIKPKNYFWSCKLYRLCYSRSTWNILYLAIISMCPQTSGRVNVTWRARSLFRPQIDNTWVRLLDMLYWMRICLMMLGVCMHLYSSLWTHLLSIVMNWMHILRIIFIEYFFDNKPCKAIPNVLNKMHMQDNI